MGGAWNMSHCILDNKSRSHLGNLHELRGKRLVAQVSQTRGFALYLRTGVVLMPQLESSWHGRSVDHVAMYSGRQISVGSRKPSRITRQNTCCASESNTSVRVVFANWIGFDAPIGVVFAWEERGSCLNVFRTTNRGHSSETFTNYEAKDLLRKSVDHVAMYSGRQISVGSRKPSRITRQKTCCAIGVVLAWEERGSCLNVSRMTNHGQISETFTNYEAKDLLRKSVDHVSTYPGRQITVGSLKPSRITRQKTCCASESNTSVRVVFENRSGFDAPIGVALAWEERGSCLNVFRTTNRGHISETFTNYEAKELLRKSVDHVSTFFGRQIAVGSQKPSRITRQKTCCASESNTSVRVVFANRSGFDAPIGVVLAWEERGTCLNVFWTTNRGHISETFTNYEAKDLLRKSVDHVSTYSGRQIAVTARKPSRITRQKTCCASESNTWVRVVFENRSGFDAPIGVVLAWEERGSCRNVFQTTNRGQISETFTNYEAKDMLRKSVDHVSTYSGRQIAVTSRKPSRITRQKTCCASESNTWVRVVFENRSGFDAPIGVVLAWEERGSCRNVFRTTNLGRISETFTNYEAKHLLRKSVDHVSTYFGRQIAVTARKPSRITRQKTCCASESNTWVRVVFENRSGFDAPIGVVLAWEERGSCRNVFRTTNLGRISETFTNYEAKDLLRNRLCMGGAWIMSQRIPDDKLRSNQGNLHQLRGKRLVAQVSQTRCNREPDWFDAPVGVVLAWEEHGSCLNVSRMTNHGQISETFTNYEAKDLLRKSVDHVSTYPGRQITVGSLKPSRITRQKTCCASESNTSVRVVFENRSGFDAPIGVALAWEERGSCLNVFRTTNRGHISETFTNYEAKELLRKSVDHVSTFFGRQIAVGSQKPSRITRQKTCCASESNTSVRVVFANRSGFDAPIGVVLAWEERGTCLNVFWTTNRGHISETFTNYEAKDLLRK
ncbi:uncharacterized protein G2W53_010372 [Senna tora]|uniref:Uncharacterized protein n=1 Tax=Senna tora TaxID=362788 RepID=A0A834X0X2_9FABA|nr:uncharacterized protein G2W53_010372 [Senna tora]